jgi:hypothetical protein
MSEPLFLSAVLLLLIAAMGFYFYSRVSYTDKKIGLLESILLDIKMNMDMESQLHIPPPLKEPEPFEPEDSQELTTDVEMYSSVIESAAIGLDENAVTMDATNEDGSGGAGSPALPDYDSMSREELNALAEKRSLRVTKSMKKGAVVNLLRQADKESPLQLGMEASLSTEGSTNGAPLGSENSLEAETLSS